MKAKIRHNKERNGLEITFPGRIDQATKALLDEGDFHFHPKLKYWYAVISTKTLDIAEKLTGEVFSTRSSNAVELIKRFVAILNRPVNMSVLVPLKMEVLSAVNEKKAGLQKYLSKVVDLLEKLEEAIQEHGEVRPQLSDKSLERKLREIAGATKVIAVTDQFALFGIEMKGSGKPSKKLNSPESIELDELSLCGLECLAVPEDQKAMDQGLSGSGLTPYDVITNMILEKIEKGDLVWRQSWSAGESTNAATNYISNKRYRGINSIILNYIAPGKTGFWITWNQIQKKKGKLIKGAKARPVFYYSPKYILNSTNEVITEEQANVLPESAYRTIPILMYYRVFDTGDVRGLKPKKHKDNPSNSDPIETAVEVLENMPKRPPIHHGGDDAYYSPSKDSVQMPKASSFKKLQAYYGTLFHELVHSTGHPSRLNRDLSGRFGSKKYAFEELIAELGASFLCGESGILYYTLDNSAAYIDGWSKKLTDILHKDNKFFIRAAAMAQKAADYIQGLAIRKPKADDKPFVYVPSTAMGEIPSSIPSPTPGLSGLTTMSNVSSNVGTREYFDIQGEWGKLLGRVERAPTSSVVAAITAEKGTGKSHSIFQAINEMAESGYKVLFVSLEEYKDSDLFQQKKERYISPENQRKVAVADERDIKDYEHFLSLAQDFDIIILDSWQELEGQKSVKDLRSRFNGKLWLIIFHATTEGRFKGGTDPQHKADIVFVGRKHIDFNENYLTAGLDGKNRYNPNTQLRYMIAAGKTVDPNEKQETTHEQHHSNTEA